MIDVLKDIWKGLGDFFSVEEASSGPQDKFTYQTFTYFVPAPKQSLSSYREKQFDKVIHQFLNQGWEVVDLKTQECQSTEVSGMWVIFLVKSSKKELFNLDREAFDPEVFSKSEVQAPQTEKAGPKEDVDYIIERDESSLNTPPPELDHKEKNS